MTTKLTDEQIAELERLLVYGTRTPWRVDTDEEGDPRNVVGPSGDGETQIVVAECFDDDEAAVIAAARNALPSLLAEVRASRSSSGSGEREALDPFGVYAEVQWTPEKLMRFATRAVDDALGEVMRQCGPLNPQVVKEARGSLGAGSALLSLEEALRIALARRALSSGSPSPATGDET